MTKSKGIKRPDWSWSAAQNAALSALYLTHTHAKLAEVIGCTEAQVARQLKKLSLRKPIGCMLIGRKLSAEHREKLRMSMKQAALDGRLKRPAPHAIELGLIAAMQPDAIAKRAKRAADTMRGIPQRMEGLSAAAEHNARAKTYTVISPLGVYFTFRNLSHFVREHPNLFRPQDVVWKPPENNPWCRAQRGLASLFRESAPRRQWKGWVAVRKENG